MGGELKAYNEMMNEARALATKRMCRGNVPVYGLFSGQKIPKTKEIVTYVNGILSGENKEVF